MATRGSGSYQTAATLTVLGLALLSAHGYPDHTSEMTTLLAAQATKPTVTSVGTPRHSANGTASMKDPGSMMAAVNTAVLSGASGCTISGASTPNPLTTYQQEVQARFAASEISTFLSTYDKVITQQTERKLVLTCGGQVCGGLNDRVMGVPLGVALALATGRQLTIDETYFKTGRHSSVGESGGAHYFFRREGCSEKATSLVDKLLNDPSPMVTMSSHCEGILLNLLSSHHCNQTAISVEATGALQAIDKECTPVQLCGAAIVHRQPYLLDSLSSAWSVVDALMHILPDRNYTALHVRTGGSRIKVAGKSVRGVNFVDGRRSAVPQTWLEMMARRDYAACEKPMAFLTDSDRLLSEMRYLAKQRLKLVHCCTQGEHIDKAQPGHVPIQEFIDLFVMSRASHVVTGIGKFATLGQYWMGRDGPRLTRLTKASEVRNVVRDILQESACHLTQR